MPHVTSRCPGGRRDGFTLTEFVVVLAILVIILALLMPAIQNVREAAARSQCANNMRQLGLAVHQFQEANGTLPPYWNSYPKPDSPSVKGSWFDHLLPYVEQQPFYDRLMDNIRTTKSNWDGYDVTTTETYTVWVVDKPGYWEGPPDTWVVDRPGYWEGPPDTWVEVTAGRYDWVAGGYNGHVHWEWKWIPPVGYWQKNGGTWHPPVGHWQKNGGTWHPPVGHNETRTRTVTKHIDHRGGIFMPGASDVTFTLLQCPSDPSVGSYPEAGRGRVYQNRASGSWGSTNYLGNWHAFAGDPTSGYKSTFQKASGISDGLSNTILLGEGYSWCDDKGRLALNAWDYHSFGITWPLNNAVVDFGDGEQTVNFPNGMPNTIPFQIRPLAKRLADCPRGADCCNNWTAQTGHQVMNVTMADGSVRSLSGRLSRPTWDRLLRPADGQPLGTDW